MPKNIFFGIWEFIFTLIIIIIFIVFVWPAITNYIDNQKQDKYNEVVSDILDAAKKHVDDNKTLYTTSNVTYKVTLSDLAKGKYIKTPIENPITGKNFDNDIVYVSIYLNNGEYEYKLFVNSEYEDAKDLYKQDVQVGDYVNYPVNYANETFDLINLVNETLTSWRVISVSNDEIKIISAGVPTGYDAKNEEIVYNNLQDVNNYKCDNTDIANDTNPCLGNYIDLNYVKNEVSFLTNDRISKIAVSSDLRTTSMTYFIVNGKDLMYIDIEGNIKNYLAMKIGVRPILTLRKDIRTTGKINNEWMLVVK